MSDAPHRFGCRVYYEDTDFSGVVYHASYLRFMERGRTEFLRDHGIHHTTLFAGEHPVAFVVRSLSIEFIRPARMDDLLTIETWLHEIGGATFAMTQRIVRGSDILITAELRCAVIAAGRAARLPAALATILRSVATPREGARSPVGPGGASRP